MIRELGREFRKLRLGVRRSIIIGTVPGSFIIGGILGALNENYLNSEAFFGWSIFVGIPIYWICVLAGVWIYQGFKEKQE